MNDWLDDIIYDSEAQREELLKWCENLGFNKYKEIYESLKTVIEQETVTFFDLRSVAIYDFNLSNILFTILKHVENKLKAFLCNNFNGDFAIKKFRKDKKYVKDKRKASGAITYKYSQNKSISFENMIIDSSSDLKSVPFYEVVKGITLGTTVNCIFKRIDEEIRKEYLLTNKSIRDLDKLIKLRNYIYHHNILVSKPNLLEDIKILFKFLPNDMREKYIDKVNQCKTYKIDGVEHQVKYCVTEISETAKRGILDVNQQSGSNFLNKT